MRKVKQLSFFKLAGLRLTSALVVGLLSLPAFGEDLVDIYHLALTNDPTLDVARYTLQAELEKYPQAVAGLLPTLKATSMANVTNADSEIANPPAVKRHVHAWDWSLQLTQPLFRMQNIYAFGEAKRAVEQARAKYSLAEQDMILRVARAYFGVMATREEIKVVTAELAAAQEQLKLATKGFEKGVSALTDVLESQSEVDLARSHLVTAHNELKNKSAELAKIVGTVPEHLHALTPSAIIPIPEPNDVQHWIKMASENSPAVRAAESGLLAADEVVGKARSEHDPTLDLVASYGGNYSSGSTTLPVDYKTRIKSAEFGIQLTVPLYSGGLINSHVTEAVANKNRAASELEVAIRQASTDARTAFDGVMDGMSQIKAYKSAVDSGQAIVNESKVGYKLGVYNNFKVLDAVKKLYGAKRDLVKARYETLFQALKLKAAAGVLTEGDIANANALLE